MKKNRQGRIATVGMLTVCLLFGYAWAAVADTTPRPSQTPAASAMVAVTPNATGVNSDPDMMEKSTSDIFYVTASETSAAPVATQTDEADATPSPQPSVSPSASADESATPETTPAADQTPAPSAEGAQAEASETIQISSIYLQGANRAAEGEKITLRLVLALQNTSGVSLNPFGIRLDASNGETCSAVSITHGDGVTFSRGVLWVTGATADGGHATVAGETLKCVVSWVPFPTGETQKSMMVSLTLTDASGHAVVLKNSDQEGQVIQTEFVIRRQNIATPAEETAEPDQPENTDTPETAGQTDTQNPTDDSSAADTLAPLDTDPAATDSNLTEEGAADPSETPSAEASPEAAGTEPPVTTAPSSLNESETDGIPAEATASPEITETATPEPTPEPTPVTRNLGLSASIPYDQLQVGDTLVLTAEITGYEGLNVTLQWQRRVNGEWENVEGATEATLTLPITEENLNSAWRYQIIAEP